jgi:UDP-sugar pyrophosphorylase
MVSDDTADKTKALLDKHNNFGLLSDQVTFLRQGKVPALISNDAKLALLPGCKYQLDAKPHG